MRPLWPHQERGVAAVRAAFAAGRRCVCLTSPTGGGKTRLVAEVVKDYHGRRQGVVVFTNRRLMVTQLGDDLAEFGLSYGVRAAGHPTRPDELVQVASVQTEYARVVKKTEAGDGRAGRIHPNTGLVVIDEAHLHNNPTGRKVVAAYLDAGAVVLMVTATPVDLPDVCEELIVAGTPSELRAVGALVPCEHFACDEPDTKGLKWLDASEKELSRAMRLPVIRGNVLEWFGRLNPDRKPTILFAPDVAGSLWFAKDVFWKSGITAAHLSGDSVWMNGEFLKAGREGRQAVLDASEGGDCAVVCNRFVLREGVDMPWLAHGILACIFGGLGTYLQAGGRLLRSHPSLASVSLQDHGGNWWRHGSLNADRAWTLGLTDYIATALNVERYRNPDAPPQPRACPVCGRVQAGGRFCVGCGLDTAREPRARRVVQADGTLAWVSGDPIKPKRVELRADTLKKWVRCYWRTRKGRAGGTFRQAVGLFVTENFYHPPEGLKYMPKKALDWFRRIEDVPEGDLY